MKNQFNIFTYIKVLYTKELGELDHPKLELWQMFAILKWLSYEKYTINIVKEVTKYVFDVEATTLFYMLYILIPKRDRVPFIHKIEKHEVEISELYEEIRKYFNWSERELYINKSILDKVIHPEEKYWKNQFALK